MQETKTIRVEYKIIPFKINVKNIVQFNCMENRRAIRDAQVSRIHGVLLRDENFDSPIVVNKVAGVYRVIDGNHRIEAIKRFYGLNNVNKSKIIEVNLAVYENLSDEEEKQVYEKWSVGIPQSVDDKLNIHKEDIALWKNIQKDFPCRVSFYSNEKSITLRKLVNLLFIVRAINENSQDKNEDEFIPSGLGRRDIVGFAKSILYDDYVKLKRFIIFFQDVFGLIEDSNIYTKPSLFFPVAHIYYKNLEMGQDKLQERFNEIIGRQQILAFAHYRGNEAMKQARRLMLEYMNKGYQKNLVI